jgi:DNA-binding HxlR family transcriptional regulator
MLGKTYDQQVCSIARALDVVGERWSMLLVRDALFAGVTRFGDFQHNLGLATNVLASRLEAFVAAGIMERRRYSERPEQYEYVLTEKGCDLGPALIALTAWGDRWASPDGPPILYEHTTCGGAIEQEIVCVNCGDVAASEVAARRGPGMSLEYIANRRPARSRGGDGQLESQPSE